MCGISGLFRHQGLEPEADISVKRMTASLTHRGPDQTGIYIDDYVALGQTRLSIIDLTGGSQPLTNEDSSMWIIFNGEIFNYPSLRSKLIESGHKFTTQCDTEVILHLYEEKKEHCLEDLNGQFAFAIWDSNNEELFIARDRAGILPLFYTFTPDGKFIFGSEIKAIFSEGTVAREIDLQALGQIFTFWTTLPGKTFFKGINELPPAHFMKIKGNSFSLQRYWDFDYQDTGSELNFNIEDVVDEARSILLDAVRIRLRADVPVGSYLSGGLDSSGVTALVRNNFNNDLRTFGLTFEDESFNERSFQNAVVAHLGVDHTEEYITNKDIGVFFSEALYNMEKPVLRTAPVPLYLLSRRVRKEGYKVVLSGEGADEIFGGYNIFKEALIRKFWSRYPESSSRYTLLTRLYPYVFKDKRLHKSLIDFFRTGIDDPGNPLFSHLIRWKNTSKIKGFLTEDIAGGLNSYDPSGELHEFLPKSFTGWSTLGKAQYLEFILFMSGYLLSSQGDRMAMSHSVELRVPYLDHRLMEFMSKVPSSLKIRGMDEKYLLKRMFSRDLPPQIIKRPKNPFRAPVNYLFRENSKNLDFVSEESLKESGLFDPSKVQLLVKKLNGPCGEVDNMAAAGILSSQVIYYKFIKDFGKDQIPSIEINNYYDFRKKLERTHEI